MKKILPYILLCWTLLAGSCAKEHTSNEGEGAVSFRINLAESRAYDPMQTLVIRIFKSDGVLIRRYTSIAAMPEQLYLVAGDYKITVEAGSKSSATRTEKSYYGEQAFTINANQTTTAKVSCKTINVGAKVNFDTTISKLEKGAYVHISAINAFDEELIDQVPTLKYEFGSDELTGYFLLPEGVTNLSWRFHGEGEELGVIEQTGVIENASAASIYTLKFQYSKTPDGFAQITVKVDESTDDHYDDFGFSPQPTIKGDGFAMTQTVGYNNNNFRFNVSSIRPLSTIAVTIDNTKYTIYKTDDPSATTPGTAYEVIDDKTVNIELKPEFLNLLPSGFQTLSFEMIDINMGKGSGKLKMAVSGALESTIEDFDLWFNTGTLRAIVTDPTATNVKIAYRLKDSSEWALADAVKGDGFIYTATPQPQWIESANAASTPVPVYKLDRTKSILAGNEYEYKLVMGGADIGQNKIFSTVSEVQAIPHGDMEDEGLSCFSESNGSTPYWGSGNNSFTPNLCKQGTFPGCEGNSCAKLVAATPMKGMLAAGNLFKGLFYKDGLTTGVVEFGQSYTWKGRPSALKVKYYAEKVGKVDIAKYAGAPLKSGDQDIARIFVAIVDWNTRHTVTSGTSAPTGIWNPSQQSSTDEGKIIAYGLLDINQSSTGGQMIDVEIPICYYDRATKPSGKYTLVISAATSAYGDYMVGCQSNVMYIDDFRWAY